MTTLTTHDHASPRPHLARGIGGMFDWLSDVFYNCVKSYVAYRECENAIAHLRGFSDYELRDIGLTRGSIEAAVYGFLPDRRSPDPDVASRGRQ
jgi:uncharacterized protein YjiS (DUF1127 family)